MFDSSAGDREEMAFTVAGPVQANYGDAQASNISLAFVEAHTWLTKPPVAFIDTLLYYILLTLSANNFTPRFVLGHLLGLSYWFDSLPWVSSSTGNHVMFVPYGCFLDFAHLPSLKQIIWACCIIKIILSLFIFLENSHTPDFSRKSISLRPQALLHTPLTDIGVLNVFIPPFCPTGFVLHGQRPPQGFHIICSPWLPALQKSSW